MVFGSVATYKTQLIRNLQSFSIGLQNWTNGPKKGTFKKIQKEHTEKFWEALIYAVQSVQKKSADNEVFLGVWIFFFLDSQLGL